MAWLAVLAAPLPARAIPQPPHSASNGITCVECHLPYGGLVGMAEGALESGSPTGLQDAGANWTEGQWVDGVVSFVSGANAGQYRTVVSNGATDLTWTPPLPGPLAAGDAYRVGKTTQQDIATQCGGCHNPSGRAPSMVGLHEPRGGATVVGCGKCHEPHNVDPNTGQGKALLRLAPTWPTAGSPLAFPSGNPANDFVQGAPPYAGVCETCHTQTTYHRNSASGDHAHQADTPCVSCHTHGRSFGLPDCSTCHGVPPVASDTLVRAPAPTGSGTAGAHAAHRDQGYACKLCHSGSVGSGATHKDGAITLGFSPYGGEVPGGAYDGQSGVAYGSSVAGTTTSAGGTKTCQSIYCHGQNADGSSWGGGADTAPRWDGSVTCTSCHDGAGASSGLGGRHGAHTDPATYAYACSRCHADTVSAGGEINDRTRHANRVNDVSLAGGGQYDAATGGCSTVSCHSDGRGGPPSTPPVWSGTESLGCAGCHGGKSGETPEMATNGHDRLVGGSWVRRYPCTYCHAATAGADGTIVDPTRHANGQVEVVMASRWAIVGNPAPAYDPVTKVCANVYCHSDGTTVNPEVRAFAWTDARTKCNSCHGHPVNECQNCHTGVTSWPVGQEWKEAMPMYPNGGTGSETSNTHTSHLELNFTCENCHARTIVNGNCTSCHNAGIPPGSMSETNHIDPAYHANHVKDVNFKDGGTYDPVTKTCANTACHTGGTPQWGGSVNDAVLCFTCHGTSETDVDDFTVFNGVRGRVNMSDWTSSGHGRPAASGNYPSGNPPANFPGNPCWYCHDNKVLHNDGANPFRLKRHNQFSRRFDKECVYCHMEGKDSECRDCHDALESEAPQILDIAGPPDHAPFAGDSTSCTGCHATDADRHKTGAGLWTAAQKDDVRNQYEMMGVCLKCHDDDRNDACTQCHTGDKYKLGYDPGTGFIGAQTKATSTHFGYKHWAGYEQSGNWKGGKFCWDCHDPHGDKNIYMIHDKVATRTDGTFGKPLAQAAVSFTRKQSGLDYVKISAPYTGLCNVCHTELKQHYRADYGDGHGGGRVCTTCHEHRFSDSHGSNQSCSTCHQNKPVPRHSGFGLPRDCTKCHTGVVGERMDVMGQLRSNSHHVQGTTVTNRHCYACHWEATAEGLIDVAYHEGYNYKNHTTTKGAPSDLVVWGPGTRPQAYAEGTTAVRFTARKIGTAEERAQVSKVTTHCLGCHNDQNNTTEPFDVVDPGSGDCFTPRQYAWDGTSIAARYSQTGTATWGRYVGVTNAAQKNQVKAYSAHGNAVANHGGWSASTGEDEALPDTRNGTAAVQCFDCHSSHGSKTQGVTSSYTTFNGSRNGGNLKETQAGKGGYSVTYKAAAGGGTVNPYAAGAAQCFDCHETASAGAMPWGYQSTYGATAPILGYRDAARFGTGARGVTSRLAYKASRTARGGHLHASSPLASTPAGTIDGLCTPCHDPHGVSPTLGTNQKYALPLLKGTWLTSPYKEDMPIAVVTTNVNPPTPNVRLDQNTFTGGGTLTETPEQFAGLCLNCHPKASLTDGVNKNTPWRSLDRVHESVKGWGANTKHNFSCSKCHSAHESGLPRLLRTNGLDTKHRGQVVSGGVAGEGSRGSFPLGNGQWRIQCHPTPEGWPNNYWNSVSGW